MTIDVSGRVPVERIAVEAREVQIARTLLTLFAAVFYALGWLAGKALQSVGWAAAATKVGFTDARRGGAGSGT